MRLIIAIKKWDTEKIEGRDERSVVLRAVCHIHASSVHAREAPKVMWGEKKRTRIFSLRFASMLGVLWCKCGCGWQGAGGAHVRRAESVRERERGRKRVLFPFHSCSHPDNLSIFGLRNPLLLSTLFVPLHAAYVSESKVGLVPRSRSPLPTVLIPALSLFCGHPD
jgi:hypothetical protein